jgi:hypothetical protein
MGKIEAIQCDECGEIHELTSDKFATVQGNIYIGENEVILANGIQSDKTVTKSYWCIQCLFSLFAKHKPIPRELDVILS